MDDDFWKTNVTFQKQRELGIDAVMRQATETQTAIVENFKCSSFVIWPNKSSTHELINYRLTLAIPQLENCVMFFSVPNLQVTIPS